MSPSGRTTAISVLPGTPATSPTCQGGTPHITDGGNHYPEVSLFMDCQGSELKYVETLEKNGMADKLATLVIY